MFTVSLSPVNASFAFPVAPASKSIIVTRMVRGLFWRRNYNGLCI